MNHACDFVLSGFTPVLCRNLDLNPDETGGSEISGRTVDVSGRYRG